jgi:hypothetical protein
MNTDDLKSMLVPAAGIALGVFLTVYILKDALTTEKARPCSETYPPSTEFVLTTDGTQPMSLIELQARAGADEWGLLDRAKVIALDGAPAPFVMTVQLPKGSGALYRPDLPKGGVTFRWQPQDMAGATSACLSYSLFLPADFNFGSGGELPGLFGGINYQPADRPDGIRGLASRFRWGPDGKGDLGLQTPATSGITGQFNLDIGSFVIPKGRWVSVEQETVLNTPGNADGMARLWLDGQLKIQRSKILWRTTETLSLTGVIHDVWYGGLNSMSTAPKDTMLALTPPSISWKK